VVAGILATAGLAWWLTADRMAGMDAGPGTDLGALGWFTGLCAVKSLFANTLAWHSSGHWLAAGVLVSPRSMS
jgi:hypothetical protein